MQTERNQILADLYGNKKINQLLNKLNPAELRDDAKQELFLILATMPDEKFMRIHQTPNKSNESGLIFWSIRTLCNMMKSDRSNFARDFRFKAISFDEITNPTQDVEIEENSLNTPDIHSKAHQGMNQLHWYEREAFNEYIKLGSILRLSRETGIPYRSLFKTITNTRNKLKRQIQDHINEQK